ncbi:MAG TPA: hypothetical protein VNZ22_15440, partial [Bacillota bacterium]|nr:hypothetical protein [Bacillota bacterium]
MENFEFLRKRMGEQFFTQWRKPLKWLRGCLGPLHGVKAAVLMKDLSIGSEFFRTGVFLAVLLALTAGSLRAQLANPGFEADTPGSAAVTDWTNINPENGSAQISTSKVRSGSRSLVYTIGSGGTSGEMRSSSSVTIPKGSYVRVTAWAAATAGQTRVRIGVKGAIDQVAYPVLGTS